MKIRLAHISDLPQLKAISQADRSAAHWSQQQWLDIFHSQFPARLAWIAEDLEAENPSHGVEFPIAGFPIVGPPIAGFLVAQTGPEWELENIVVSPEFRRRGVGRALLSALLDEARARRAERVLLEVRVSNQAAIHLYRRSGFQQLACRRDYYRDPIEDALVMVHSY